MKKIFLSLVCFLAAFSGKALAQTQKNDAMQNKKILIVYYSRTENTKKIAQYIQEATGGDIFEIETVDAYPDEYKATTEQAKKEIADGYLPPIKKTVSNIAEYDVVFVGSPCWWSTIAPPVSTFLSQHDLSGKVVVPFSTHGGSGLANNVRDTAKLAPNAKVLEGEAFIGTLSGMAKRSVNKWLKKIDIIS